MISFKELNLFIATNLLKENFVAKDKKYYIIREKFDLSISNEFLLFFFFVFIKFHIIPRNTLFYNISSFI